MTCNVHVMHVITCNNILGVSLIMMSESDHDSVTRILIRVTDDSDATDRYPGLGR